MNLTRTLMAFTLLAASTAVWAHGDKAHTKPTAPPKLEQKDWGIGGNPAAVMRTVTIRMTDNMRFTPDVIQVKQGETVRFVVKNVGQVKHELSLGTEKELLEHLEQMKKFPDMEHDEPGKVTLQPGKQGEIVWQFTKAGGVNFACLMPGHYEAGMKGTVQVGKK